MEICAGFTEHTDAQVGRLVDGLDNRRLKHNTLILDIRGATTSRSELATVCGCIRKTASRRRTQAGHSRETLAACRNSLPVGLIEKATT